MFQRSVRVCNVSKRKLPLRNIPKMEPMVEPVYIETRKSYEAHKDIFMMRLNRPHKNNAIDKFLAEHLVIAMKAFQECDSNVAILFGAGNTFSGGCDLYHFTKIAAESEKVKIIEENQGKPLKTSKSCPKPIVGAIDGMCFNGGLELALNCDYLIATEDARFNLLQYQIGFPLVDQSSLRLPSIIGLDRTKKLIESGETFSSRDALDMGLIDKIVPSQNLQRSAYEAAINLFEDDLALNWESVLRTEYGDVTKADAMKRVFMQP